jgi:hypothetical protein
VQLGQAGAYVYVVRGGKAEVLAVRPLASLDGFTRVEALLGAGERVLVEVPKRLKDGGAVRLAGPAKTIGPDKSAGQAAPR